MDRKKKTPFKHEQSPDKIAIHAPSRLPRRKRRPIDVTSVVNAFKESVFTIDRNYCYTSFNTPHAKTMKDSFGSDIKIGGNILEYITSREPRERIKKDFDIVFSNGKILETEFKSEDPDIPTLYIKASTRPIFNDDGELTGLLSISRNITEQKLLEEKYKKSEIQFDTLFMVGPDAVVVSELESGRIIEVNPSFESIFKFTREEVIGKTHKELNIWENINEISKVVGGLKKRRQSVIETTLVTKDNEYRACVVSIKAFETGGKWYNIASLHDVSELRQIEQVLATKEDHFRSMVSATSLALWELDSSGKILTSEGNALSKMTLKPGELTGKNVFETAKDDPALIKHIKRGLSGEEFTEELHDRELVWQNHFTPRFDDKGNVIGLIIVSLDITELRNLEQKQRDAEVRFQSLFMSAPDAVFLATIKEGRMVEVNHGYEEMFGYKRKEVIGKTSKELNIWVNYADRNALLKSLDKSSQVTKEIHFRRKDGEERICNVSTRILTINSEPHILGIIRDITERRKSEEAIKESEERWRSVFNNSPIGISITDTGGTIINANHVMSLITQYSLEELEKISMPTLYKNPADIERLISQVHLQGFVPVFETQLIRKNGSICDVLANSTILHSNGNEYLLTSWIDITRRKETEKTLKESEHKFRELFNNMGSSVAVYKAVDEGTDFVFVDFNNAAENLEKMKKEEVIGRRVSEAFPGVKDFGLLDVFTKVWLSGEPARHPITLYKDQRVTGWRENYVYKLPGGEIVAIYDDMTDILKTSQALRETSALLSSVFDSTKDLIWTVDANDFRLTSFNQSYSDYFLKQRGLRIEKGMPPEALCDTNELAQTWRSLFQQALKEGSVSTEYLTFQGSLLLELNIHALKENDKVFGISVFGKDITERKRAEDKIRESEDRWRSIFNNSPIGIGISERNGRIISANQELRIIIGYTIDELENVNFADLFYTSEDRKYLQEVLIRNGTITGFETKLQRKDGVVCDVLLNTTIIRPGGKEYYLSTCIDITNRKLAEEALKNSEERYRTIIETAAEAILIADVEERKIVFSNPAARKMFGYSAAELNGLHISKLHPTEALRRVIEVFEKQHEGKPSLVLEEPCYRKDGSVFIADINAAPVNIFGTVYMAGFFTDVTERKRADEAIKYQALLVDNVNDSIIAQDMAFHFQTWNKASEKIYGWTAEEAVGKYVRDIIEIQFTGGLSRDEVREKIISEGCWEGESLQKRKDGTWINIFSKINTMKDEQGKPTGMVVVNSDITERKKAEVQLINSERRFRSVFENAIDGMILMNIDGSFKDCNTKAEEIYGRPRDILMKTKPWDFSPSIQPSGRSSYDAAQELFTAAFQGQPQLFEWSHIKPDGTLIDTEIHLNKIELAEGPAVLAIVRDITERKNFEKMVQEARESERTRLAREIHDSLSQTLASAGLTAGLIPKIWEKDQNEAKAQLRELSLLTVLAQEEMHSLLFELYPAALKGRNLGELIKQLSEKIKKHYQVHVNVKVDGTPDLPDEITVSLYRITQEAMNNIAKHSKAKHASIHLSFTEQQTLLKISDNGVGFDISQTKNVGMGLRNMLQRAKQIGAFIDINSVKGKGTVIEVKIEK